MLHIFKSAASRTITYSLLAVVVFGLLVGTVRLALPFADLFRGQIADALGETLGLEVRMSRFRLRLAGMVPRITLEDVDLLDRLSGDPQLQLMRLHLDLNLAASIKEFAPQVDSLTLEGARLQIERHADGSIAIAGLDGVESGDPRAMTFFLASGRFLLAGSDVIFRDAISDVPQIMLTDVRIRFDNDASRHRIGLRARLAEDTETHLHLAADLHGEPHAPAAWSGRLYLDWQGKDLPASLGKHLPAPLQLRTDRLRVQSWNRIADSRIAQTLNRIELEGLVFRNRDRSREAELEVKRIDALLHWSPLEDSGRLELAGKDMRLALPRWFDDKRLHVERIAVPMVWERLADGSAHIDINGLELENTDFNAHTRFTLDLASGNQAPSLDLYAEIRDVQAQTIREYIPTAKLKPKLRNWLDQAFLGGQVPWASIRFQGRPNDFPFRRGEGQLATAIRAKDVDLRFHPEWPRLESVDGIVRLDNTRLDIDVSSGRLRNISILGAHGRIPDLTDAAAIQLEGTTRGAFSNGLAFLGETPLRRRLGALADVFRAQGTSRVDLSMSIPLRKRGPEDRLELTGALSWPGPASLALSKTDLTLKALEGTLNFNQSGIAHSHLEATLWGTPLSAELERDTQGDIGRTKIVFSSATSAEALAERLPNPLWRHLRGASPWSLEIRIPNQGLDQGHIPFDFNLMSDLRGMALKLPAPLGKHPSEPQRLRLKGSLRPGENMRLDGRYADHAFNLLISKDTEGNLRLQRAGIAFGSSAAPLPKRNGLHLSGQLEELDLSAWMDPNKDFATEDGNTLLGSAELRLDRLRLAGAILRTVHLELERDTKSWEARVESDELAGRIVIPHRRRNKPLEIALERLDLEPLLQARRTHSTKVGDPSDPRHTHTLDLSVEQLRWGSNELGRLSMSATAREDGLEFDQIRLDTPPFMQVSGSGRWRTTAQGQNSLIDLEAEGEDLGKFLRHLGFRSQLEQAPASAELQLAWPGGPSDFNLATLSGQARVAIGAGSLLDVDPGVGRMLGVLNLDALQRRLTLDFSDLFGRGYAFERMYGELDIHEGRADIVEMHIEGPSAKIRVEGKTDLLKQEFDQVVTVTPDLGSSVALASAMAGGPLVGAAVLIADKVSGGAVDKIGRYQYDITGPWITPRIERRASYQPNADAQATLPDHGRAGAQRETQDKPPQSAIERSTSSHTRTSPKLVPEPNLFLDQH